MKKADIIKKIKTIIKEHGDFTCADVEANSSPVVASLGKDTHQLAESFGLHKVTAVTYVHETETGEDYIKYEDLKASTLKDILELAKEHKERQED